MTHRTSHSQDSNTRPLARRGLRLATLAGALAAAFFGAGAAWLYAQPGSSIGSFGPTGADPSRIMVGTPTVVTVTSRITDPRLKKRSVILLRLNQWGWPVDIPGRLRDDGRSGDAVANDNVYTLQTTLEAAAVGTVAFRVAARFKPGRWSEPEADDDDWDKDLSQIAADPVRASRERRFLVFLFRLLRYAVSDVFGVTVAEPAITWSPDTIDVSLAPGASATRDVTFTSDFTLQNVTIVAGQTLSGLVSAQPIAFATVPAGQPRAVTLTFTIPSDATAETRSGTLSVGRAGAALSLPLAVQITITPPPPGAASSVGLTQATPSFIDQGVPTAVRVTSMITDATPVPGSVILERLNADGSTAVLGMLRDNGLDADLALGDGIFTAVVIFDEPAAQEIRLRVAADFEGPPRTDRSEPLSLFVRPATAPEAMLAQLAADLAAGDIQAALTHFSAAPRHERLLLQLTAAQLNALAAAFAAAQPLDAQEDMRVFALPWKDDSGNPLALQIVVARSRTGEWLIVSW